MVMYVYVYLGFIYVLANGFGDAMISLQIRVKHNSAVFFDRAVQDIINVPLTPHSALYNEFTCAASSGLGVSNTDLVYIITSEFCHFSPNY